MKTDAADIEFLSESHTYSINGVTLASVTQVVSKVLGDKFGMVDSEVLERARDRGKLCHAACHAVDEDDLDWDAWKELDRERISQGLEPILPRVESYVMWRDSVKFVPVENEKIVADKDLGVAGTLDKKGILYGKPTIIDLKSGPVGPETALQTAGYAILDGDVTCARYGLQLVPGKIARPTAFKNYFDIPTFKALVTVYGWMKKNGY